MMLDPDSWPLDLLIYFKISMRLALLGTTRKPRFYMYDESLQLDVLRQKLAGYDQLERHQYLARHQVFV